MPQRSMTGRRLGRTGKGKTQMKLFNAAIDIMSESGPDAASVEEVALRAGVSKGTVYYNFGSKKTMIDMLLQYGTELLLEEMELAAQEQRNPKEALRMSLYTGLKYLEDKPGYTRLWLAEVWKNMNNWSNAMEDNRKGLIDFIEGKVTAIRRRYPVDREQDVRTIAIAIFGAAYVMAMDQVIHDVHYDAENATNTVMMIVDGYMCTDNAHHKR